MSAVESINIIEDAEGELRVSSLIIAGRTETQHKNVLELVERYSGEFDGLGGVAFETRPLRLALNFQGKSISWPKFSGRLLTFGN